MRVFNHRFWTKTDPISVDTLQFGPINFWCTITQGEHYFVVELVPYQTVPWVCLYDASLANDKRLNLINFRSYRFSVQFNLC